MREGRSIFLTLLGIILFITFLPALLWLVLIIAVIIFIFITVQRIKMRRFMDSHPHQSEPYEQERTYDEDIIDVEYSERDEDA